MFSILCVCTGNICRSPVAERLLSSMLGSAAQVRSAGTRPAVGAPISPPMAELLADRGVSSDGFAARSLNRPVLETADLVLTATRGHRAAAVELWPATVRRAYTLKEFARLVAAVDPALLDQPTVEERLRAAVGLAARHRGYSPLTDLDDIADPYGRSLSAHRTAFDETAAAVHRIGVGVIDPHPVPAARRPE